MSAVSDLVDILDLEPLEHNLYRGRVPQVGWQRVFGGLVIAQALAAAQRTVLDRQPHSLHAYFLLGGDPNVPIVYEVDRIRDGRSFTTRRVVAIQHGRAIFAMSASFHAEESEGFAHRAAMPPAPTPEEIPAGDWARADRFALLPHPIRNYFERERPIDIRPASVRAAGASPFGDRIWFRANRPLPDEPAIHQCVLAYSSDITLLDVSLIPHDASVFDPAVSSASLDHAMWFHGPFRADEWLLYAQDSPYAGGGRGFSRGQVFRRDGTLIASVSQEGLIRKIAPSR